MQKPKPLQQGKPSPVTSNTTLSTLRNAPLSENTPSTSTISHPKWELTIVIGPHETIQMENEAIPANVDNVQTVLYDATGLLPIKVTEKVNSAYLAARFYFFAFIDEDSCRRALDFLLKTKFNVGFSFDTMRSMITLSPPAQLVHVPIVMENPDPVNEGLAHNSPVYNGPVYNGTVQNCTINYNSNAPGADITSNLNYLKLFTGVYLNFWEFI